MSEIKVLGKNPEHQGSRALKGIKSWKIEKTKCDRLLLQEIFLVEE
jgi:hypothetical protein